MLELTVNAIRVIAPRDESLLSFLREELGLTSVKNGCAQGACGACMILVDGIPRKACTLSTARAVGKQIVTCEGLSARERAVYAEAFAVSGAVQCGFCTPGMVMSAKGLLDRVRDPTPDQIRQALKNNICRCTGYQKIVDAVLLCAKLLQTDAPLPDPAGNGRIGERLPRVDAAAKALGDCEYTDDLRIEGLLFGSAVRSAYPRAIVRSIDCRDARAVEGVVCVMTADDLPGNRRIGHLKKDYDVMIAVGDETHFLGDAVALVAAESRAALERAKALVRVEYEPLEPILSPEAAMASNAPRIHPSVPDNLLTCEHLTRGDADAAIRASKYVVTTHYSTPPTEHAFLETETAVALPDGDGGIQIHCADQGIYQTRRECAEALGLPPEKVRVIARTVGGGFGGKEDMSVQHHAALLAQKTGRPVKVALSRDESILIHPKRHGMEMDFTTACDENGMLTAMKAVLLTDSGAYASLGGPVLQRACTHAAGPYRYQNIDIVGRAYYTNNPPCGAFRGFGVTQSCFAGESNLDLLAEKAGISPWEIRYRNAIRPGQTLPNGQLADDSTALVETLEAVKPYYDAHPRAGIACAMKNSGLGVGVPDVGRARLWIQNGRVCLYSSAACIGQGLATALIQIVCETTGLPPDAIRHQPPDTALAPDSGNTTASRQTLFTGEATRRAALALRDALRDSPLSSLEGREFNGEYTAVTDPLHSEKEHPVSHVVYAYATHLVDLDERGRIAQVLAAHDVGRGINPLSIEGQIEGGVTMSLGYALTEDFPLEGGRPTARFATLGLLRADQVPPIRAILIERSASELAGGAKGIGEICAIPTAPAVALAYYHYDGIFRTRLPLEHTPYRRKK